MNTTAAKGSVPAQPGIRYSCQNRYNPSAGMSHDSGDGRPTRKKCSRCGGGWTMETGYYFVLKLTWEQMNIRLSDLPMSTAVNAFRNEAQAKKWSEAQEQNSATANYIEQWLSLDDRRFEDAVAAVNGMSSTADLARAKMSAMAGGGSTYDINMVRFYELRVGDQILIQRGDEDDWEEIVTIVSRNGKKLGTEVPAQGLEVVVRAEDGTEMTKLVHRDDPIEKVTNVREASKQAGIGGDDDPGWSANGDDRVYLVDTDNRPIVYGDDASPTPATFLWPRAEAQAAIGTAYVRDPGYDLPAAQIMEPAAYKVVWAERHGQQAWWLTARTASHAQASAQAVGNRVTVPLRQPAPPVFDMDGNQIAPMPWVKASRISREELEARFASKVTTPCPNCGEQVRFIGPAWSESEQARYEDEVPWACDGCGSHGTEEDLRTEASLSAESAYLRSISPNEYEAIIGPFRYRMVQDGNGPWHVRRRDLTSGSVVGPWTFPDLQSILAFLKRVETAPHLDPADIAMAASATAVVDDDWGKCPECIGDDHAHCSRPGCMCVDRSHDSEVYNCPRCKHELSVGSLGERYCEECGLPLYPGPPNQQPIFASIKMTSRPGPQGIPDPAHQGMFPVLYSLGPTGDERDIFPAWDFDNMVATHGPDGRPIRSTALGEQKAPPQVDTLRDEQCPVCGEADAYSGNDCPVCGYVKPPDAFTDPDTSKAKEVDLRGGTSDELAPGVPGGDGQQAPAEGLERFRVDGPGAAAPAAGGQGLERFRIAAKGCPECNSEQEHPRFRIGRGTCRNEFHKAKAMPKAASGRVEVVIDYGKCYMSQPAVAEKLLRGLESFRRNQDSTDRRVWTVPQMMWDEWHIATNPDDADEIVSALGELGVNPRFVKVKQAQAA